MAEKKIDIDSLPDEEKLRTWVQQKKVNDEKVPKELLETKYKKPYQELKGKIKAVADKIITDRLNAGITIRKDEAGNVLVEQIRNLIKEKQDAGAGREMGRALMEEYSVDKYLQIVESLRIQIWNLWIPYWQNYCCLYVAPECWEENGPTPRVYNELTGEFLVDDKNNVWEKHPEWETEKRTIITAGACRLLAKGLRNKEEQNNGQTGKH